MEKDILPYIVPMPQNCGIGFCFSNIGDDFLHDFPLYSNCCRGMMQS